MMLQQWRSLYVSDWFHSLVDLPTTRSVSIIVAANMAIVLVFAILFLAVSRGLPQCDVDIYTLEEAFVFSLETYATIGYGAKDIFFGDCWLPAFILMTQVSACKHRLADDDRAHRSS